MQHRNIRALTREIYKVIHGISPPFLNQVFVLRQCNYELCGNNFSERRRIKSLAPKIWEILPNEIKDSNTLQIFKAKIKKWIAAECHCRLCAIYLLQVGYI